MQANFRGLDSETKQSINRQRNVLRNHYKRGKNDEAEDMEGSLPIQANKRDLESGSEKRQVLQPTHITARDFVR